MLQRLLDEAPDDHFTLDWLVANLRERSYGMLMLVLALFALIPGVSFFAGLLLMIPALQMIAGRPAPVFPRRVAALPLSTRHLAEVVRRTLPVLKYLEKLVHPRWHTPPEATKRLVGAVVLILSVPLVAAPIPFGNVVPALVIALISLAYLEEDGLLLRIAFVGRRHGVDGLVGGGLGGRPRCEFDYRPVVADLGGLGPGPHQAAA